MCAAASRGSFVWYDLLTPDPKAAVRFYASIAGWKIQPFGDQSGPDPYSMWVGSQGPLGGVMILPEEAKKMGAPPHWVSHVQVDNVEETLKKVRALGGQIYHDVEQIPTVGRVALIADPQGAPISVFTPLDAMSLHDSTKHGEFSWCELLTTDHRAAIDFYSKIFGWEVTGAHDMGPLGEYMLYGHNGVTLGGMFTKTADMPMPPMWIYYLHVDNMDEAVKTAVAGGAQVLMGPHEVPGGDMITQLLDPQGAMFALHSVPDKKA